MANICDTTIQFGGDDDSLVDLFTKLVNLSAKEIYDLKNIVDAFGVTPDDAEEAIRGHIEDIDEHAYRLYQSDRWTPHIEVWTAICKQYYNDKIWFVYKAEEPGSDIYINTDTNGLYFPEKYVCDYSTNDNGDVRYFENEEEIIDWLKFEFGLEVSDISEAEEEFVERFPDGFLTIGEFQPET